MNSLELFSGAGGLAKGLERVGFKHLGLLDVNKYACQSLRFNYPKSEVIETDIRAFDFSKYSGVDLIAGGPPCQPFSMGGKAKGWNDDRDMFPYAIKGVSALMPKAFIFENVKGLLRKSFSTYFKYIFLQLNYPAIQKKAKEDWIKHLSRLESIHTKGELVGLKYNVAFQLVNSANYGIPQKRERVIIIGIRNDIGVEWSFPSETHSYERLLWDKFVSNEYWERNLVPLKEREQLSLSQKKSIEKLKSKYGLFEPDKKSWITVREALKGLPNPKSKDHNLIDHQFRDNAKTYPGHTGSYIDAPAKTLKAGVHGVPGGENMIRFFDGSVRYFTIREAKLIQTFPDNYLISGSWTEGMRQLGNAVPVKLGEIIGTELKAKLQTTAKSVFIKT
ncbi:MAG: DNA cytosine methyltransferase [Aureispira sp.]